VPYEVILIQESRSITGSLISRTEKVLFKTDSLVEVQEMTVSLQERLDRTLFATNNQPAYAG
jgi:hypothetical protein